METKTKVDDKRKESLKKHAKVILLIFQISFETAFQMLGKKLSIGGDDFLKHADEAFDMMDMDGNGTIERGDIE